MKIDSDPHYCYNLQVWLVKGTILDCNHPAEMKASGCCNAHKLAGEQHGCQDDY